MMRGRPAHRARQHGQAGYPSAHSRGLKGAGKGWRMPLEAHPQSLVCYHNCEACRRYELDRIDNYSPDAFERCLACGHAYSIMNIGGIRHHHCFPPPFEEDIPNPLLAERRKTLTVTVRASGHPQRRRVSCTLMTGREVLSKVTDQSITRNFLKLLKAELTQRLPEILEDQPRLALDGEFYARNEFEAYYGDAAEEVWRDAASRTAEVILVAEGPEATGSIRNGQRV
ncbi:unnamed protein product [Symbiodinium natans]|uniref:Uncharacterized protein n=1 Tax=Symbiodinium natans TaxID=878477 RepID=A0A812L8I7_9DINO|nr:unnamed protein product [Symbiodinium natans]